MSLINQVLKDLEQRREGPVSPGGGGISTTPRYTVARRHSNFILYIFGVVLLVLSLAMGFLVWDRLSGTTPPLIMSMGRAPAPAPTVSFRPSDAPPAEPGSQPPPEDTIVGLVDTSKAEAAPRVQDKPRPAQEPLIRSEAKGPEAKAEKPAPEKTVAKPAAAADEAGRVEKQRRPLTPRQLADKAFAGGYAALRRGDLAEGERQLRAALRHSPGHVKSREMLAGIYIKSGRYVEAGQLLQQGIAIQPAHSMFRKLYARVLLEQQALDKAVAILEQRLPALAQDTDYYALLAALYQRQGRYENAAALYRKMLDTNPMVGLWWIGLGISLEKLEQNEAAREAYEKARASGTLAAQMIQYTDNRLAALQEIGYPDE